MALISSLLLAVPTPAPPAGGAPATTPLGADVFPHSFLLSVTVWVPFLVAALLALLPNPLGKYDRQIRLTGFWVTFGLVLVVGVNYSQMAAGTGGMQFVERLSWLPVSGVEYHLAADGLSLTALLVGALVMMVGFLAIGSTRRRVQELVVLMLVLLGSVDAVFVARDALLLAAFWTTGALAAAGLVAGSVEDAGWERWRHGYALHQLMGAAVLWFAILLWRAGAGGASSDLDSLLQAPLPQNGQVAIAVLIGLASVTRLPLFPFHTWARATWSEAPLATSVVTAGPLAASGGYLLLRLVVGGLPAGLTRLAPYLAAMVVLTAVYAAARMLLTADLRRAAAVAALLPGTLIWLGVAGATPLAIQGSALLVAAGGAGPALVVCAGQVAAVRAQTRSLGLLGGIGVRAPRLAWLVILAAATVILVPGLVTFLAGFEVVAGSARSQGLWVGAELGAMFLFMVTGSRVLYRLVFSPAHPEAPRVSEAGTLELWTLIVLAALVIWVGILPGGPKLFGIPILDPGVVNVVGPAASDLSTRYAPPAQRAAR